MFEAITLTCCTIIESLIRAQQRRLWNRKTQRLGGLEVDHQLEFGRLRDGEVAGLGSFQDLVHVSGGAPQFAYKMACTGPESMTVSGEMTYAATSYEGRMRMVTQSGGQSMEMGQTFVGKRVGDCTATK